MEKPTKRTYRDFNYEVRKLDDGYFHVFFESGVPADLPSYCSEEDAIRAFEEDAEVYLNNLDFVIEM